MGPPILIAAKGCYVLQVRPTFSVVSPFGAGTPPVAWGMLTRSRLLARLDEAMARSRLVLVGAEAGSGKTNLVSDWASRTGSRTRVCWWSLGQTEDTIKALGALPVEVLDSLDSGARLRGIGGDQPQRRHRPASPAPDRWVVVLDDLPTEPAELVNTVLDSLLRRTGHEVSFLVVCSGSPALDRHRLGLPGSWRPIGTDDLALEVGEIAEVLACRQVETSASLVERVHRVTAGWAWGVEQAATSLERGTTSTAALRETDLAIADYLESSILCGLSACERDLLTATSVSRDVTPDLAAAIVGDQRRLAPSCVAAAGGFIQTRGDGSFTLHPILRRHLMRKLGEQPDAAIGAARRAAQCTADHGDLETAIDIAVAAADWTWAARTLIESLGVARWLALGAEHALDRPDVVDGLGGAEPLLRAVAALGRSWPDAAELAVQELRLDQAAGTGSAAEQLSDALVRMSLARWRADAAAGLTQLRRARALLPKLTVAQRRAAPELSPLMHAHLAAFELWNDAPDRARAALERGARAFRPRPAPEIDGATQVLAADCRGRLAWLEAMNGELTKSLHHASEVLTARPADSNEIGVVHAQLATAWCHISRCELEQAAQRLESVTVRTSAPIDGDLHPEVATATALTVARLAAVLGAGRIGLGALPRCLAPAATGRLEDQLRLIRVEAELDSGQPAAALQLLAEVRRPTADAHALRSRAAIQVGDLASVSASLRVRPADRRSLITQVGLDLIQGWVAQSRGDRQQLRALVDRALRVAEQEQLRAPIAWATTWLHEVVTSDATLVRLHGTFLASLRGTLLDDPPPQAASRLSVLTAPVPPLTERELEVLQRLGTLSTNTEIAVALYLSPNTVKTHLKSLYRKLEVTRRSDAFRRGRSLGLC
jgi:LuxR family maltose regulon positive regulatory protein